MLSKADTAGPVASGYRCFDQAANGIRRQRSIGGRARHLPDTPRPTSRSSGRIALGIACAQSADVDEACQISAEALDLAVGMAAQPNLRDVFRLRQALEPWRSTDLVRAFGDRLAAVAQAQRGEV